MLAIAAMLLGGCRARAPEPSGGPTAAAPPRALAANGPAPAGSSDTCSWQTYRPPTGCYVAQDWDGSAGGITITDQAALTTLLKPYPPDSNRPPCDPSAEAEAFDFAAHRLFIAWVPDADGVVPPEPVRVECTDATTRVIVSVDKWCGGDERGPGRMLVVVPAGETPIELVNEGRTSCPPGNVP